jgi:hypothetical protein
MSKRDDEMAKSRKAPPFGKDDGDGDEKKAKRGGDSALGPDEGTSRAGDAINPDNSATHAHAEHGGNKAAHSSHMPNC